MDALGLLSVFVTISTASHRFTSIGHPQLVVQAQRLRAAPHVEAKHEARSMIALHVLYVTVPLGNTQRRDSPDAL